jgi:hypothetical protein
MAEKCVPGTLSMIEGKLHECIEGEWVVVDPIARPAREPGLDLGAPADEADLGGEGAEADS